MRRAVAILRFALVLVVLLSGGDWLRTIATRIPSPYPLEGLEGAIIAHALRWSDGQAVYGPPSAEFIPTLYPPLGYIVQAAAMQLLGAGLPAARAAAVAATLGVVVLLALVVYRRARSPAAALAVAGTFIAAYVPTGSWYDLARNDMLFLLCGLASVYLVTGPTRTWRTMLAAILAALSLWTRQQGLAFVALGCLHLFGTSRRQALLFTLVAAAAIVPGFAFLDRATQGWFLRYTWSMLGGLPLHFDRAPHVLGRTLGTFWGPLACAMIFLIVDCRRRGILALSSIWALLFVAFSANAALALIREGGDLNHCIPMLLFALVLGGFAVGDLDSGRGKVPALHGVLLGLLLLQVLTWPRPSLAALPRQVREIQQQVVAELAAMRGDVLVLEDPYYLRLAGKPLNADGIAIFVLEYQGLALPAELEVRITGERYAAVVLSDPVERGVRARTASGRRLNELVQDHYALTREIRPADPGAERLRVPRYLYLPRGTAGAPPGLSGSVDPR